MALQVWLPLKGNLNNHGVAQLTSNGSPTYSDGKMGKALNLNNKVAFTGLPQLSNFTISFWANVNSCTTDWADLIGFKSVQSNGSSAAYFRFEATISSRACSWHNNTPYAISEGTQILIANKGEWHHVCVTYDGKSVYSYTDGVLLSTQTGLGGYLIDAFHIGETGNIVGQMNDLRVYDECMSAKEVRELSKGLALHFPLKLDGQTNMFPNSESFSSWSIGSGWTQGVAEDGNKYLSFTRTGATANNWVRVIPNLNINPANYPDGITVSFDFKCDDLSVFNQQCICALQTYTAEGNRVGWYETTSTDVFQGLANLVDGEWKRIRVHFTQNNLYIVSGSSGYAKEDISYTTISFQLVQNGTVYYKNIKCEPGNIYTSWNDGKNQDYHLDCSGHANNGLLQNGITYATDSPRYTNCANFKSGGYIYSIPTVLNSTATDFSISFWFKMTGTENGAFFNNRTNIGTGVSVFFLNSKELRFDTGEEAQWNPGFTVAQNTWYHICFVRNTSGKQLYVNGKLYASTTSPGIVTTIGTHATIGVSSSNDSPGGNQLNGCMSDFRLYVTALNAEDILDLYQVGGSIDNSGRTYGYEFMEEE